MQEKFNKKIKEVSKEELKRLIENHEKTLNKAFLEEHKILLKHGKRKRDLHDKYFIEKNLEFNKDYAKKVVLHKLSNVCIHCNGEKPFADMKEVCPGCANLTEERINQLKFNESEPNKELIGDRLNHHFKYSHKMKDWEKKDLIDKSGADI